MTVTDRQTRLEVVTWEAPANLTARATLFLLTGRGESPEVYQRFGARLAADAYRVVVISAADHLDPDTAAEIALLVGGTDAHTPTVLIGSDAGARAALQLAGSVGADAVVTAGLPVDGVRLQQDWKAEIESRTSCPNHQRVLQHSTRGSLFLEVPSVRLAAPLVRTSVAPVLAIHGGADRLSPLPRALAWYAQAGIDDVWVVEGGLHDILNDVTHRSVAATIVLFLERVRLGPGLPVIVRPAVEPPR